MKLGMRKYNSIMEKLLSGFSSLYNPLFRNICICICNKKQK